MKWALLVLAAVTYKADATTVYKCVENNITKYSDVPCGKNPEKVRVDSQKSTYAADAAKVIEQCFQHIKKTAGWKDPDSLQLVDHHRKWLNDTSGARQVLILELRARNGFGGYDGTTFKQCFLDHNGTGLSTVQELLK